MPNFTNSKMGDVHFTYGPANRNAKEAGGVYVKKPTCYLTIE